MVLCAGFGSTQKGMSQERASELARQGFVALTLDYRGFGESDGPRGRMIPRQQVTDIRAAITFLQAQDGVDPERIGLYGSSFGGANVCYTAGVDERVKAVLSVVGVGQGKAWLRAIRPAWQWRQLLDDLAEDAARRATTGQSKIVDRLDIMTADPATKARAEENLAKSGDSGIPMPLETAQAVIDFHPEEVVGNIAPRPILFIVAERDVLVPNEVTRELFDRAGEPKRWMVLPGIGHYDAYAQPAATTVAAEASAFFKANL
ncbi:MAG: alpha/beta fold hydrolase [Mycolicibacterium sp.]|nr:alpha/beta fold hydrolase [Mycolicibacterium sp.]